MLSTYHGGSKPIGGAQAVAILPSEIKSKLAAKYGDLRMPAHDMRMAIRVDRGLIRRPVSRVTNRTPLKQLAAEDRMALDKKYGDLSRFQMVGNETATRPLHPNVAPASHLRGLPSAKADAPVERSEKSLFPVPPAPAVLPGLPQGVAPAAPPPQLPPPPNETTGGSNGPLISTALHPPQLLLVPSPNGQPGGSTNSIISTDLPSAPHAVSPDNADAPTDSADALEVTKALFLPAAPAPAAQSGMPHGEAPAVPPPQPILPPPPNEQLGEVTSPMISTEVPSSAPMPSSRDGRHTFAQGHDKYTASTAVYASNFDITELDSLYDRGSSWTLGQGGMGAVSSVKKRATGEIFALKVMQADPWIADDELAIKMLLDEVDICRGLDHINIAPIFETFVNRQTKEVSFVMQLCSGGTLTQLLTRGISVDEHEVATLTHNMLAAIHYCHQHGVVHRDIKMDNFIFTAEYGSAEAELKLIDFGLARRITAGNETFDDGFGTLDYMAPEMFLVWHQERRSRFKYDSKVDLWALGIIVYQLLFGQMPFGLGDPEEDALEVGDRIVFEPLTYPSDHGRSELARNFVEGLLQREPERRLTAEGGLTHTWIKQASELRPRTAERARPNTAQKENISKVVRAVEDFEGIDALQRHIHHALAFSMSSSQTQELRRIFTEMDVDNSGTISFNEFRSVIESYVDESVDVERLYKAMDPGGNGEVEWRWFLAATMRSSEKALENSQPTLIDAFLLLDRDHDGFVTVEDLEAIFHNSPSSSLQALDRAHILAMMQRATPEGSVSKVESLSIQDFRRIMLLPGGELSSHVHSAVWELPAKEASERGIASKDNSCIQDESTNM
ncbi:hypothetical protein AB1Y20_009406 [Prymnesium parvum]|uniref:Non-specific serine/threonine protein kinase n=1 Tax=Prymnesium parvum TaxID=97485 RepID=A0AB34K3R3_PRYPA